MPRAAKVGSNEAAAAGRIGAAAMDARRATVRSKLARVGVGRWTGGDKQTTAAAAGCCCSAGLTETRRETERRSRHGLAGSEDLEEIEGKPHKRHQRIDTIMINRLIFFGFVQRHSRVRKWASLPPQKRRTLWRRTTEIQTIKNMYFNCYIRVVR
jgi:hypothetical protein